MRERFVFTLAELHFFLHCISIFTTYDSALLSKANQIEVLLFRSVTSVSLHDIRFEIVAQVFCVIYITSNKRKIIPIRNKVKQSEIFH